MVNRFGTTSDMVIRSVEENGVLALLAIDDKGLYLTSRERLDKPLADPNRYAAARQDVSSRLQALGLNPDELLSQNQHLIKKAGSEGQKKINPLKASKRGLRS